MTYSGGQKAERTEVDRPAWVTLLGIAAIVGAVAFAVLALALVIGSAVTVGYALAGLALAGALACVGGYSYFMRERGQ